MEHSELVDLRLAKIEAHLEAMEMFLVQTAAWLPDPQALMEHLPEDLENSLLHSQKNDLHLELVSHTMSRIYARLLQLRHDMNALHMKRIAAVLPMDPAG